MLFKDAGGLRVASVGERAVRSALCYSRRVGVHLRGVGGGAVEHGVRQRVLGRGVRGGGGGGVRRGARLAAQRYMQHTAWEGGMHYLRRCAARGASTSGGAGAAAGAAPSHGHVTPDTRSPAHTHTGPHYSHELDLCGSCYALRVLARATACELIEP